MKTFTAGNFSVDVATEGYPVWVTINYGGREMRLHHSELADLTYVVERAKGAACQALGPAREAEV